MQTGNPNSSTDLHLRSNSVQWQKRLCFRNNEKVAFLGFTNYLLSEESYLFDITHKTVCQEMNQPFSNYFIATSHNTYLVEDQLKGPSSCEGYVAALRRNCRFIEGLYSVIGKSALSEPYASIFGIQWNKEVYLSKH